MYDADRHLGSLANQLYRARDDLRTAQLQLQRARSKKKTYKRGLAGRTKALQTAYNHINRVQRAYNAAQQALQDFGHKRRETRTILITSRRWDEFPDEEQMEQGVFRARHEFNIHGGFMGTKIKWVRLEWSIWGKFAAVPDTREGTRDGGGITKIWLTLEHKWDDREHQAHTRQDWEHVAQIFIDNQLTDEAHITGFKIAQTT